MKKDAQHQAKYWLCNFNIHIWVHIAGNYNPASDTIFWRRNKKDKKYKFYPNFLTKNQTAVKALNNFSYTKLHAHETNQIFWNLNPPNQVIPTSFSFHSTNPSSPNRQPLFSVHSSPNDRRTHMHRFLFNNHSVAVHDHKTFFRWIQNGRIVLIKSWLKA